MHPWAPTVLNDSRSDSSKLGKEWRGLMARCNIHSLQSSGKGECSNAGHNSRTDAETLELWVEHYPIQSPAKSVGADESESASNPVSDDAKLVTGRFCIKERRVVIALIWRKELRAVRIEETEARLSLSARIRPEGYVGCHMLIDELD